MLLRLAVENHLSLRTRQELTMLASALRDEEACLLAAPRGAGARVLPAAVIYGANASGKSNIIRSFSFLRSAVLHSHSRGTPSGKIPREHFALDPGAVEEPTKIDVDFAVDGMRYHYGFAATDEKFVSEWLYAFPGRRRQLLFERSGQSFSFGRSLKGRNKIIADLTRPNSLFLSAAIQNDHTELTKVSTFFRDARYHGAISVSGELLATRMLDDEIDNRIIKFLGQIGTGITGFKRLDVSPPEEVARVMQEVDKILRSKSTESVKFGKIRTSTSRVQLGHKTAHGETVYFDADDESAGTRRLLLLLGPAFSALDNGGLLVVDELDASLHTQACEAVLRLFCNPQINTRGAQVVATTHDTNLLSSAILRRDQVWFTEKDTNGATHLYPLSDFHTRQGDNLEKGYLQGRYGAIPFSGSIEELIM